MSNEGTGAPSADFMLGGGEMGALMRARDWSASVLGAPAGWPQALKIAIRLILNTGHPMYVFWGQQLVCFYNDAYRASIGAERHPGSLGQPAREVWAEIWDVIGPQIDQVMTAGGPTWHENQLVPITRHGAREEVYWTYSYGPIDDPAAPHGIGGVLVVSTETTGTVLAERHRAEEAARQRRLFEQAPGFIAVMQGPEHRVEFVNDTHRRIFGGDDWVGKPIREAFPEIAGQGFFEWLDKVYSTGERHVASGVPARFKRPSNGVEDTRILDFIYAPLRDEGGRVTGVFCEGLDVTERIVAEAALRESEVRFGEVANAAPVLIWMSDTTQARTWFNKPWHAFTGRTAEQEEGDGWAAGVHPDDVNRCAATFAKAFERREVLRMDYRLCRHDGEWRTIDDNGAPRFSVEGLFLGYIGSCIDVTDQRETEAALRASEAQLRLATDLAEVGLWDVDVVNDSLYWPPRVKAMFGISPQVPVSMADFYAGLHPQDREQVGAAYDAAANSLKRAFYDVEYRTLGKEDGVLRWVAAKGRGVFDAAGNCVRLIGTALDITRRKLDEERLRESEASLAATVATMDGFIASAPIGIAFFDRAHRYVRLNTVLANINGAPVEAHIGKTIGAMTPARPLAIGPILDEVLASAKTFEAIELDAENPARPGETQSWLASFFPVFGAEGGVEHVGATLVDFTERRRAEAAVRGLNETLEAQVAARTAEHDRVWRNSRDLLVVVGSDGVFRAISPSWTTILGHSPEEVVGRHFDVFVWPDDCAATQDALELAASQKDLTNFENRYRHRDGTPRWISWRTSVEEGLVFAYGRDVTIEKEREAQLAKVEEALRQAQKMEAIGQLTGGIAHDFNNLLQGVAGNFELIRRKAPDDGSKLRSWAESGLRSVERGAKLTNQLLAFSRSQKLEMKPVVVADLLANMREMLARTLGPAVRIGFDLESASSTVLGDDVQLEMAVLNLTINARDAMPDGGELRIATSRERIDGDPELASGEYVQLSVSDTGTGMAPAVAARAFDPFFTTKGVGKGTGLGLSQVYGMMRQAGGAVRLESRPGAGTTVRLYLPCTDAAVSSERRPPSEPVPASRVASVLIVDDDPDVRRFLVDSLEALGYRALQAEDGYAGIAAVERSAPDALIVDFAMPGMTGAELAREVRTRRPGLPIIFASGFADTAAIENLPGDKAPILRKPFRIDELQAVLADALGKAGNAPLSHA